MWRARIEKTGAKNAWGAGERQGSTFSPDPTKQCFPGKGRRGTQGTRLPAKQASFPFFLARLCAYFCIVLRTFLILASPATLSATVTTIFLTPSPVQIITWQNIFLPLLKETMLPVSQGNHVFDE